MPSNIIDGQTYVLHESFSHCELVRARANDGDRTAKINGLEVHGEFKFSQTVSSNKRNDQHPRSIVFRVTANEIISQLSGEQPYQLMKDLELEPGQSKSLTFNGVIQMKHNHGKAPITITPIIGNSYQVRVSGEGSQTINVIASIS